MAGRDLSRYRIMASYILIVHMMINVLSHFRLWLQCSQKVFGEGSERLHAGHEIRKAHVRRGPDYACQGAEHSHSSRC